MTLAMLTLAVISVIASLGVFGKDRLIFCREASSGEDLLLAPSPCAAVFLVIPTNFDAVERLDSRGGVFFQSLELPFIGKACLGCFLQG